MPTYSGIPCFRGSCRPPLLLWIPSVPPCSSGIWRIRRYLLLRVSPSLLVCMNRRRSSIPPWQFFCTSRCSLWCGLGFECCAFCTMIQQFCHAVRQLSTCCRLTSCPFLSFPGWIWTLVFPPSLFSYSVLWWQSPCKHIPSWAHSVFCSPCWAHPPIWPSAPHILR